MTGVIFIIPLLPGAPDRAAGFVDFGCRHCHVFAVENGDDAVQQAKRLFDRLPVAEHVHIHPTTPALQGAALRSPLSPIARNFERNYNENEC